MKVLGLVTAKSKSSRIEYKNKVPVHGKPLYKWTTDFCENNIEFFDCLVFSSDKPEDYNVGINWLRLYRPPWYILDSTPHIESVKHALSFAEDYTDQKYDLVVLMQPTNPLRNTKLLYHAMCVAETYMGRPSLAPHVSRCVYVDHNLCRKYLVRSQWYGDDINGSPMVRSGALYTYSRDYLKNPYSFKGHRIVVSKEVGYNINDPIDIKITEALFGVQGVPYGYTKSWASEQVRGSHIL